MKQIHKTLIKHELIRWAANNDMSIKHLDDAQFLCNNDYAELHIDIKHVYYQLNNGWTIDEICENESYSLED